MTPAEREAIERRISEINHRLGILNPKEISGGGEPPTLNIEELEALREERENLMKQRDSDAD